MTRGHGWDILADISVCVVPRVGDFSLVKGRLVSSGRDMGGLCASPITQQCWDMLNREDIINWERSGSIKWIHTSPLTGLDRQHGTNWKFCVDCLCVG
jgi:hypothetical protein